MVYLTIGLLLACSEPGPLDGTWLFTSQDDVSGGFLKADQNKALIGLWGAGFGTDGIVEGTIGLRDDIPWVYFSVETGLGDADAALRLQGREAMLPLGARRGEHEVRYKTLHEPSMTSEKMADLERSASERIAMAKQQWTDGAFLLQTHGETVGQIHCLGSDPPIVVLFDQFG